VLKSVTLRRWEVHVSKVLRCADLMPDCDTVIEGKDADEVLAKAEAHARKEHNMTIILPSTVAQMEKAIRDK
jgi:predicted small metal-binding protein